jgi:SAM-dependent methyltransferase/uncharacterized protein YbaR (Trm112 family)
VRVRHFDSLRPCCPVCRDRNAKSSHPLRITSALREESGTIVEGLLGCSNPLCQREYPIIDGIPLILPAIRSYVTENVFSLCRRTDLSETIETLLGDATGPSSLFDSIRQHLSSYTWDHYAEFDPTEAAGEPPPGSVARLLECGLDAFGEPLGDGPIIDIGCGVGRSSFELAERTEGLVLGIDMHHPMLRLASEALQTGSVRYSRRRVGVVYDRREFPLPFGRVENLDFWACDAAALPLDDGLFSRVVCLNVLDSTSSPVDLLRGLGRALAPGGLAMVGCPYDWAVAATPIEGWLGGHSQRSVSLGASEAVLRNLLTPGAHPWSIDDVVIRKEIDEMPWQVRLHDRSTMHYRVHLVIVQSILEPVTPAGPASRISGDLGLH